MRRWNPSRTQLLLLVVSPVVIAAGWLLHAKGWQLTGTHLTDVGGIEITPRAPSSTSELAGPAPAGARLAGSRHAGLGVSDGTARCTITGRAVDWEGNPIGRFQVALTGTGDGQQSVGQWFWNSTGEFKIEDLSPGSWIISARADEQRFSERVLLQLPHEGPVELICSASARVSGVVLHPSGAPASGARVSLGKNTTTSGEDGCFLLSDVPPGGGAVEARLDALITHEPLVLDTFPGVHRKGVELQLGYSGTLAGVVLSSEGEPESDVEVELTRIGRSSLPRIRSDANGEFAVHALAPGHYLARVVETHEPQGERRAALEIVADEVTKVVLRGDAASLVFVTGLLTLGGEPVSGEMLVTSEGRRSSRGCQKVQIAGNGRFELRLSEAGAHVFRARTGTGRISPFYVNVPESALFDLHLELSEGRISGILVSVDGSPASDREVLLEMAGQHNLLSAGPISRGGPDSRHLFTVRTDDTGRWSFDGLGPGKYSVFGHGKGWGQLPLAPSASIGGIELGEGGQVDGIVLTLRQGGMVWCRVLDTSGKPVSDAAVFVRDTQGEWVNPVSVESTFMQGVTAVADLPPGRYTFMARTRDGVTRESAPVEVASVIEGESPHDGCPTVDLELLPGAGLRVQLLDARGSAIHATITVYDSQGRVQSGTTCFHDKARALEDGIHPDQSWITPLLPGSYRVTAIAADGRQSSGEVVLRPETQELLVLTLGS